MIKCSGSNASSSYIFILNKINAMLSHFTRLYDANPSVGFVYAVKIFYCFYFIILSVPI